MSRPAPVVVRGTGTLEGLEVHVAPIGGSPLVDDYQIGHPALAPFFAGHPYDIEAYRRKATEVERRLSPADRARVADALRATTPRAAERLRQVLDGAGFFVTTGQQAGLFGGPLYTLHKVLSAVRLAATLERELQRVVVPVFWVAADDHDFDEIDHILAIDDDETLHRVALTRASDAPHLPMSEQPLGAAVLGALDAFAATLPAGPFADDVIGRLRAHYRPGRSVAAAFEATMAELLAQFDVVVVSSAHPALKRAAAPVLARELAAQAKHAALLERTSAALEAAGYGVQVPIAPDVSNVFHHDDSGRDRL
ncbi:MAG: bacillithiol biosynthesis protein BshC, partial [Longimicrobiales bacterium]